MSCLLVDRLGALVVVNRKFGGVARILFASRGHATLHGCGLVDQYVIGHEFSRCVEYPPSGARVPRPTTFFRSTHTSRTKQRAAHYIGQVSSHIPQNQQVGITGNQDCQIEFTLRPGRALYLAAKGIYRHSGWKPSADCRHNGALWGEQLGNG